MLSIQQLINTLRRLQVTSNGRSLKAAGRNKVIKNLQRAIDDCVVQIEKQGHRITQNTAIMITSPLSSSTTTTATVTTIPTRSVNDNNHHLKNVQYERRLSEFSEIIKMSSLSTITLFSESLSTLVTALRALIILYDSEENKITLNSNSKNTNNNIITIIKDNTNNNNSKNSNINNCSSQLMNLKIGSMATDETDVKIVKITTAIETKTAEILTARTAREVETETKAESVTVTYNKRQELDSLVRRFSTNLYVNEIGSILLNCEWQQRQQQQSYQWNYRKNEKQFNEHSLIQVKLNNENNFIKFYQNNQQFPLVSATTTTKTSILYNRSKQQQQYQKRYIHIRNLMSMDMNQSLNMNDEQQEQNSNELFGAMVTALQQQRLHDCTNADSVGVDGVLCCNNLKNTNSENTVTTTPTTKVNTPMPTTSTTSSKSTITSTTNIDSSTSGVSCHENYATGKPCFNTGLNDILKFMELIGNLKHTKRTGWLLRDVNDCESISGHMYRMGILTFLLDGSEGLNQTRCMELALVHDMAESLVGDITPFCGVSKVDKQAMEFKAMEDICKLIEPRGKRIMELFEEYELGESPESQFVKDLDRLDMVMQAFEYEKRDNCLLKHQEFFDSTAGKFKHPFVKKLVNEIYEQRNKLAKSKGAILPPKIDVPSMELKANKGIHSSNGHLTSATTSTLKVKPEITTTTSATKTTGSTSNSNSTS